MDFCRNFIPVFYGNRHKRKDCSTGDTYQKGEKMSDRVNNQSDDILTVNQKIEDAIAGLQKESTPEMLAHTLTVIRRGMRQGGQLIVAVEPPKGDGQIRIQAITSGGKIWWAAFTSFEEELKGGGKVKSTFMAEMEKLFETALSVDEVEGVIINPWNRTIMLNKRLMEIILGKTDR